MTAPPSNSGEREKLKQYLDRLEALDKERQAAADEVAAELAAAKAEGFNPKVLKALLKRRQETPDQKVKRVAFEDELDRQAALASMLD